MRAVVLSTFYDMVDNRLRQRGEAFEVAPARFNEICRKGRYLAAAEEAPEMEGEIDDDQG